MRILNLGCGTKASAHPEVVNIDWSVYLRLKRNPVARSLFPLFFRGERLERFRALPENILVHNLKHGIPFPNDSVDVIYHSHLLEHLDRDVALLFLKEIRRALRSGGIVRIVVPDLEHDCRRYLSHLDQCRNQAELADEHDQFVATLYDQSVRREAFGTSQQRPFRRLIENLFLGDARQRGETHQWMYDEISLKNKLLAAGFSRVERVTFDTSLLANWNDYGLDLTDDGQQYKPGSLYMEAVK